MEKKFIANLNLKSISLGEFSGYASVFDVVDQHRDVIKQGAFNKNLNAKDVKFLWQHDPKEPIGWFEEIRQDNHGLFVRGKLLLESQRGKDAYELIKNGAIKGLSIGFDLIESKFNEKGHRLIEKLNLWEISLVTFPSNVMAQIICLKGNRGSKADRDLAFQRAVKALWKTYHKQEQYGGRY